MKKGIILGLFVTFFFLMLPSQIHAANSNCSVKSNGQAWCKYDDQVNDEDFRYSITKVTKANSSSINLYGWGILYQSDSYGSAGSSTANKYEIEVIHNGKVIKTIPTTLRTVKNFTCSHFQKTGNFSKFSNADCEYQASWSDSSFVNFIYSRNSSSGWNNIYRSVGFSATLNIDEIKNLIAKENDIECPSSTSPSCVKDNCGGVADEKNNTNDNLCTFKKEANYQFYLRIKLTAPAGAVKNSNKVFYKDIALYRDVVPASVQTFFESKGMSISETNYSKSVVSRATWAMIAKTAALPNSGSGYQLCGTACQNAVRNATGWSKSNTTIYLPSHLYHQERERTFTRNINTRTALYTDSSGNVIIYRIKLTGTVSPGVIDSLSNGWFYVLFPSGLSNRKGYNGMTGYITESWTYPSNPRTMIDIDVSRDCKCTRTPISFDDGADLPTTCKDNAQTARKNDSIKVDDSISVSTNTALDILLNGDNSSFATQSKYQGMSFDAKDLASVRNSANYSSTSTPAYCLKNRTFKLYGKNDILGAWTLGEEDKNLYAGRYFRIKDNSMNATISQSCISSNSNVLNNVLTNTNLKYDTEYEPDALETNMINNKSQKNKKTQSYAGGYLGSITSIYKMQNDRQYYFDYSKNEVVITPGGYVIDDRNIYPIPTKTPANRDHDITTSIQGDTRGGENELGNGYKYVCNYSVVEQDDPGDPGDPSDPNNPDDPGENISENENYYYRTISLSDVFPEHRGNKRPYNWRNVEIERAIETKGNKIYAGTPQYIVTLTTSNMKSIRRYNLDQEENGGYLNNSLECIMNNGVREDCRSTFLDNIVEDNYAESFERNVRIGGN